MASSDRYIFGLDIGTSKTCALVCERVTEGKLEVVGLGVAESRGWRKGVIVNLDSVVLSIKKAVEAAEAEAKISFETAYVSVGGAHLRGMNSRGAFSLGPAAREVTLEDKVKAFHNANGINRSDFWLHEGPAFQSERPLGFVFRDHDAVQPDINGSDAVRKILQAEKDSALKAIEAFNGQSHLSFAFRGDVDFILLDGNLDVWLRHHGNHLQEIAAIRHPLDQFIA